MSHRAFVVFDTGIGRCGIAWSEQGLVGVQLPESDERATRARLMRRFPDAIEARPPAEVDVAVQGIRRLLSGERVDLSGVVLDLDGVPAFHRQVYEVARSIPAGSTLTYGDIANRLGAPDAARAVGQALGQNPFALVVPCHRVLAVGGKLGGFSAPGGRTTKLRLLTIEGASESDAPSLFDREDA